MDCGDATFLGQMTSNTQSESRCSNDGEWAREASKADPPGAFAGDTRALSARTPDLAPAVVARAAEGDRDAWKAVVERYQGLVYSVAYTIIGDRTEAEDAAQEAFLRVFRSLRRYRGEASFATWIYRVAISAAVDHRRRRRARGRASDLSADVGPPRFSPGPELTHEQAERCRTVLAAMGALRPALRKPLVLREVYGLGYDEMAQLLGRPVGTLKAAVHRGRRALVAALTDADEAWLAEVAGTEASTAAGDTTTGRATSAQTEDSAAADGA